MYSQYIPHFPTLWLTKDERSLLYKYFILNPSLCCISSIVSSHLQILYIVQKSADLGKGHVLVGSPASPGSTALLPGRDCEQGSLLLGLNSAGQGTWSSWRAGCGHAARRPWEGPNSGRQEGAGARSMPVALQAEDVCAPAFSPWPGWEWESKNASLLSKRFTNSPVTLSRGETVSAGKIR